MTPGMLSKILIEPESDELNLQVSVFKKVDYKVLNSMKY
jgi:hypothetical protein